MISLIRITYSWIKIQTNVHLLNIKHANIKENTNEMETGVEDPGTNVTKPWYFPMKTES